MKPLLVLSTLAVALSCGGPLTDTSTQNPNPLSQAADVGTSQPDARDANVESTDRSTLRQRVDVKLTLDKPTMVPGWDVVATLIDSRRLLVKDPHRKWAHVDASVIRFQRGADEPIELSFGREGRVHTLYGHQVAVFGGATLTVFPPGVEAWP